MSSSVTCIAPINIAVIKYWGKLDETNNVPLNSSISVTLDVKDLCTETTLAVDESLQEDQVYLNGNREDLSKNKRINRCLSRARALSKNHSDMNCYIKSYNNFPTAAGLASSASGYACLAKCLGEAYSLSIDLTTLARLGSGSACRSIHGGFVKWMKGSNSDDSRAVQIASEDHWKDLKCLILIVSNKQKSVPSTEAMRRSVQTSKLLNFRVNSIVEERIKTMENAILEKDFKSFAELTMKDSNQLHAICQDTYPPITPPYMNDVSHQIVNLVNHYNKTDIKAAYTFDAGANAVLFTLQENLAELIGTIMYHFPQLENNEKEDYINISDDNFEHCIKSAVQLENICHFPGALQRIIVTQAGPGASVLQK